MLLKQDVLKDCVAHGTYFKQIKKLVMAVLRNSLYALTVKEIHSALVEYGYEKNLDTTRKTIFKLKISGEIFFHKPKNSEEKVYFVI